MENNPGQQLFDLLVTQDLQPNLRDSRGREVESPDQADLFEFEWHTAPDDQGQSRDYGTVVALMGPEKSLEIYYGDNLGRGMESQDRTQWYDFLEQLKNWSVRNMLGFELNNINRLKYTMQGMAAIREGLFEGYHGRGRVSYSDQPQSTRIMIRHARPLHHDEPRHRAIESLFIETAQGERFRVPTRNLTHARMLARHVAEGGTPYDPFGQHITNMVAEINTLGSFTRAARQRPLGEAAQGLTAEAIRHLGDLKAKARRMISRRGYHEARETWDPSAITDSEAMTHDIREMFLDRSLDSRIESALPVLARVRDMAEAQEFDAWSRDLVERVMPDLTQSQQRGLEELMADAVPVGPDATNALTQIDDVLGRPQELSDALQDLAAQDADADARPVIQQYLAQQGIDIDIPQTADSTSPSTDDEMEPPELPELPEPPQTEDLDTDGVMMTRASNMSSESLEHDLDRLVELARR